MRSLLCSNCVQQLCTVQRTHTHTHAHTHRHMNRRTDLTVVCWLGLAFLWLYCLSVLDLAFWDYFVIVYLVLQCFDTVGWVI